MDFVHAQQELACDMRTFQDQDGFQNFIDKAVKKSYDEFLNESFENNNEIFSLSESGYYPFKLIAGNIWIRK